MGLLRKLLDIVRMVAAVHTLVHIEVGREHMVGCIALVEHIVDCTKVGRHLG